MPMLKAYKKHGFILIIVLCLLCVTFAHAQDRYKPQYLSFLDTSKGRQLLLQCSRSAPTNVKGFWVIREPERAELSRKFKRLLTKLSRQYNVEPVFSTFQGYCVQCIGVIIHGRKFIYISGFKLGPDELRDDEYKNWQTEPIVICDGGDSVWGALFNTRSKSFSQLKFNGVG